MTKKFSNEPDDKAAQRLKQMLDARMPQPDNEEASTPKKATKKTPPPKKSTPKKLPPKKK